MAFQRMLRRPAVQFPLGTATPSEVCGRCHQAIFQEVTEGFGADLDFREIVYEAPTGQTLIRLPRSAPVSTLHAIAGTDPFPLHARDIEAAGRSCTVCHYPQPFEILDIDIADVPTPIPRPREEESGGLTCASCHLTPGGKIRGPYDVSAPHATVRDPKIQTSAMCAFCHSEGARLVGKQTQTFLEWREDFSKRGLGPQQCQDCHMPPTERKMAEDYDVPVRRGTRHLWTGGHSVARIRSALNLAIVQPETAQSSLDFHVINTGAGHSVPTGSNRRAVYLRVDVHDGENKVFAAADWMFAPWFANRPDDRKYLEEDRRLANPLFAQADAQGPHEAPLRAGEERVLSWAPTLPPGTYTVRARLIYDLNRYNDPRYTGDQTEINHASLAIKIGS